MGVGGWVETFLKKANKAVVVVLGRVGGVFAWRGGRDKDKKDGEMGVGVGVGARVQEKKKHDPPPSLS